VKWSVNRTGVGLPLFFMILLAVSVNASATQTGASPDEALVLRVEGYISPITHELVIEALNYAQPRGMVVVLVLDTPGGSLDATFKIIEAIERSATPVVGFVYPAGGRAWSAGTMILMATHVAAMAPNTIIGSAQPVSFDPLGGGSTPIEDAKLINALEKFIAERARRNGRNPEVASRFVKENLNLNDEEALRDGVIEVRAGSLTGLLVAINGFKVEVAGATIEIRTAGAAASEWTPSLRVRALGIISEPMIAYMMFIIGFYALFFGLSSPGLGGEVLGGLLLIMGLIGLGFVGVNTGALILTTVGFALLVAELFSPGFGLLGAAGMVCVSIGSFLLLPREWSVQPEWLNTLYTVLLVVPIAIGAFFVFVVFKVIEARMRRPFQSELVGTEATAEGEIRQGVDGWVILQGERWRARSDAPVKEGSTVKVVGKIGPILVVEPVEPPWEGSPHRGDLER